MIRINYQEEIFSLEQNTFSHLYDIFWVPIIYLPHLINIINSITVNT